MISLKLAAFPQRNLPRPGTCGVGDPACDLAIEWTLLTAEGRQAFRERLPVGETAWARGRGWAVWKTLATCAYTLGNDDQEAANARRILGEIFSGYTAGSTVRPHPCPAPTVY
jgi:aminoglycoside phosphotransferase (APT) family kinase protein